MTADHKRTGFAGAVLALGLVFASCRQNVPEGLPDFSADSGLNRPNALIVLVDALRRDHLGAYGYKLPTSPNIEADPNEQAPLEKPLPDVCARLASALESRVAQLALIAEGGNGTVTLDADEVEALRALGYLD